MSRSHDTHENGSGNGHLDPGAASCPPGPGGSCPPGPGGEACSRWEPLLTAYLLAEATEAERSEVESHLSSCEHCRGQLQLLQAAREALAAGSPAGESLPPVARAALIERARSPRRATRLQSGHVAAAAAALLVAAVLVYETTALRPGGGGAAPAAAPAEIAMAVPAPGQGAPGGPQGWSWSRDGGYKVRTGLDRSRYSEQAPPADAGGAPAGLSTSLTVVDAYNKSPAAAPGAAGQAPKPDTLELAYEGKLYGAPGGAGGEKEKGLTWYAVPEARGRELDRLLRLPRLESEGLAAQEATRADPAGGALGALPTQEAVPPATNGLTLVKQSTESKESTDGLAARRFFEVQAQGKQGQQGQQVALGEAESRRLRLATPQITSDAGAAPPAPAGREVAQLYRAPINSLAPGTPAPRKRGLAESTAAPAEPASRPEQLAGADALGVEVKDLQDLALVKKGAESRQAGGSTVEGNRPARSAKSKQGAFGGAAGKGGGAGGEALSENLADKPAGQPAAAGLPEAAAAAPAEEVPAVPAAGASKAVPARPAGAAPATVAALTPLEASRIRVEEFLSRLERMPGETPDMMFYRFFESHPFREASSEALSTFGLDVDTASYTLFRSYLYKRAVLPPREAIRTEEFLNYFKAGYAPPPAGGEEKRFAIHADLAPSPFAHEAGYSLLRVGVKAREVSRAQRKACSLVFVVDTSGSMRRENRLELVKDALRLLVGELDEGDTLGIVAFDREARTILEPTPAARKERILDSIATLEPRQNTNVAAGLELGYRMAAGSLARGASNRVILLSDGVANTGVVDPAAMLEGVRVHRERGIYLTCVGVGMGNLNDALLQELADRGDGHCVYVDRLEEARKVFVENLTGTLEAVARNAKVQVEFNPARVIRYRLLGYENRALPTAAFRDNRADAGEVGAGHEITALYELKLAGASEAAKAGPEKAGAKQAGSEKDGADRIATVRLRYTTPEDGETPELAREVLPADVHASFEAAPPRFQLAACVAELAEVLRESYWARNSSLERVSALLEPLLPRLAGDRDVEELVALVKRADALVRAREAARDDVAQAAHLLKENWVSRARIEDVLATARNTARVEILEDLRRQSEELRRRLEDVLAK